MRRAYFVWLIQVLTASILLSQAQSVLPANRGTLVAPPVSASPSDLKARVKVLESYGKLPLSFEANRGQADGRVKFLSHTGEYSLFLTADELVLAWPAKHPAPEGARDLRPQPVSLKRYPDTKPVADSNPVTDSNPHAEQASKQIADRVLRMKLHNANPAARLRGVSQLAGTTNYFIGDDPAEWRTNIPAYAKVKYEGVYPGIDLVYYGNQRQLEYDFIVAGGADPQCIAFDVHGAKRIRRDAHGDLILNLGEGEIRWHKPVAYQWKDGARQPIAANYAVADTNRVSFELAKYDTGMPLYIDPLIYSTYLGGSSLDDGNSIAVDSAGNAYVTGTTYSSDFPTTNGAFQSTCSGCGQGYKNAFVTKINPAGSAFVYSSYLGGKMDDAGVSIAVDSAGNAYVTGQTASNNFPTKNPLQKTYGGGSFDAFVTKINPSGSALVYSTFLGGSGVDFGQAIAVDSAGNAYVTGQTASNNFPTMNPLQAAYAGGGGDAFVAEINAAGSALVYSTYLGGSVGIDYGAGIAVNNAGTAWVTGTTYSTDFPTKNAMQPTLDAGWDAFVTKIGPLGSSLVYSTYLGGSGDGTVGGSGYGIAVDKAGNAYVTGYTTTANYPTTPGAFQTTYGGNWDAVISKINPSGTALVYSTYLGGSEVDAAWAIAVDSAGNAYVSGSTGSKNFPTMDPLQPGLKGGGGDVFVSKLDPTGSELLFSTYLGGNGAQDGFGIAVDSANHAYVTGDTSSTKFPTMNPIQAASGGGLYDAFVSEIDVRTQTTITVTSSPNPSKYGQAVIFTAVLSSNAGAPPDGEAITFMKGKTVLGTGKLKSGSASFTISTLKVGTKPVRAMYGGDSNFGASKSKPVKQVVQSP